MIEKEWGGWFYLFRVSSLLLWCCYWQPGIASGLSKISFTSFQRLPFLMDPSNSGILQ